MFAGRSPEESYNSTVNRSGELPRPLDTKPIVSPDKTIRRIADAKEQQRETYRYWQSLSVGDRLSAVWDVSQAAWSFAAAFKGVPSDDAQGSERSLTRVQRPRR
jgi:hypothetical protein